MQGLLDQNANSAADAAAASGIGGKKMKKVWDRRKQQWIEMWVDEEDIMSANNHATTKISSNQYATGSNQNSGNFITDTPTTRIHAPPGGRSSFTIGQDDSVPLPPSRSNGTSYAQPEEGMGQQSSSSSGGGGGSRTSANAFASGNNQNSGNFITDTPTTRVAAPPGGRSSFTLGGDAPSQQQSGGNNRTSANSFASGNNQNSGNFMTDTPTTRVHAPPGGRSTFSIGYDAPAPPQPPRSTAAPYAQPEEYMGQQSSSGGGGGGRTSANVFASGNNQNSGNFITDTPTTRVHAPPGGKSTFTLGHIENVPPPAARMMPSMATGSAPPTVPAAMMQQSFGGGDGGGGGGNTSANRFANGSNQNCGNFITDTPTTRVVAPPGGKTSIVLG